MQAPKVCAVVLNWNRPDDTVRCIRSLLQSTYKNMQVVVVDNGSEEESYARLCSELPEVGFLRSQVNLGYAGGANMGLRYGLAQSADYFFVLNNDTVVDPEMVNCLVEAAEEHTSVGLVGPVIYFLDQPEKVWFAGYRFAHGIYLVRRGLRLSPPIQPFEEVDFVSGCGMLIRRSVLEQVGFFSEEYFMYYEDVDLCFRVKAAGMSIGCVTEARMWHAVSASSGGADSPIKQYHQVKSSLIFYRKNSKGLMFWVNVVLRFAHAFSTVGKAAVQGNLQFAAIGLFVRGASEGWRQLPGGGAKSK